MGRMWLTTVFLLVFTYSYTLQLPWIVDSLLANAFVLETHNVC